MNIIFLVSMSFFRNGSSSFCSTPSVADSVSFVRGCCFTKLIMKLWNTAVALLSSILLCALTLFIIMSASWSRACKSFKNPVSVGAVSVSVAGSSISTDDGSAAKQKLSNSCKCLNVISSSANVLKSLSAGCASSQCSLVIVIPSFFSFAI